MNWTLITFLQYVAAVAMAIGVPLTSLLWGSVLIDEQFLPDVAYIGIVLGPLVALVASIHADNSKTGNAALSRRVVIWLSVLTVAVLICLFFRKFMLDVPMSEWLLRLAPYIWQGSYVGIWIAGGALFGLVFEGLKRRYFGRAITRTRKRMK